MSEHSKQELSEALHDLRGAGDLNIRLTMASRICCDQFSEVLKTTVLSCSSSRSVVP